MSGARRPRPRDPQGRREAIVAAACEVIAEHGLASASHRLIARRADVPLGSTTYYFPTRDDLHAAALERSVRACVEELERWAERLAGDPTAAALTELAAGYLADRARAIVEFELYLAAAREPRLRPLAASWIERLRSLLEPIAGAPRAHAIAMLLDGAMLQAHVLDRPLDAEALAPALAALLAEGPERR